MKSAKRTERFSDRISGTEVTPKTRTHVVLVVELGGISAKDFQATPKDDVFLSAGSRKFPPSSTTSGDWRSTDANGKPTGPIEEERRIVVVVPRDILEFSLQFGKGTVVGFNADSAVAASISVP